jgi:hypothetical protein
MDDAPAQEALLWSQLPLAKRLALEGKLEGLYGREDAPEAFENLAVDKQQALLLLLKRLTVYGLWAHLRQVENVYGEGGVGMNFRAWPSFLEAVRWHRDFTTRFAKRPGNDGGFREKRIRFGGLHLLYKGKGAERRWDAHFDMYNPLFSPANTARHVWNEVINSRAPDWQMVRGWLRKSRQ